MNLNMIHSNEQRSLHPLVARCAPPAQRARIPQDARIRWAIEHHCMPLGRTTDDLLLTTFSRDGFLAVPCATTDRDGCSGPKRSHPHHRRQPTA